MTRSDIASALGCAADDTAIGVALSALAELDRPTVSGGTGVDADEGVLLAYESGHAVVAWSSHVTTRESLTGLAIHASAS